MTHYHSNLRESNELYQEQGIDSGIPPINDSFMESEEAEGGGRARRSSVLVFEMFWHRKGCLL